MKSSFLLMLLVVFVSGDLTAQTTKKKAPPKRKPAQQRRAVEKREPTAEVRINTWYFGNFFQAPDDRPKENVPALGIEGRLTYPLPFQTIRQPVDGYVHLDYLHFSQTGFGGSPGFRVGARSEGRPHSWDASAQLQKDRPAFDVGDQVDQADIARLNGDYDYRFGRDWQFGAAVNFETQSFRAAAERDTRFSGIGGTVRYRGFGSLFSPEVGIAVGSRTVDDPTEDYRQRDLILQVRSAPTPPLYLSARLRHRLRNYSTNSAGSSNFGRDDTRDQLAALADLKHNAQITWNFYFAYENADSTLKSRSFDAFIAMFGITYRLK
jgi:hypothetical protein